MAAACSAEVEPEDLRTAATPGSRETTAPRAPSELYNLCWIRDYSGEAPDYGIIPGTVYAKPGGTCDNISPFHDIQLIYCVRREGVMTWFETEDEVAYFDPFDALSRVCGRQSVPFLRDSM